MSITVRPLIARVNVPVSFCFTPAFPLCFAQGERYAVRCTPLSGVRRYEAFRKGMTLDEKACAALGPRQEAAVSDGVLRLTLRLPQEDEYTFVIYTSEGRELGRAKVYALEDDLYGTYPLKGDVHMHTFCSDGVESPAYVMAMSRKRGMDFAAVTDHGWYEPSVQAQQAWEGLHTEYLILRGEEIHAPDAQVHILNVGGAESVNAWGYGQEEAYRRAAAACLPRVPGCLCERDRFRAAASLALFARVRQAGGIAVFCHPFWQTDEGFDISRDVTDCLMELGGFDALELIGGYWKHEYRSNHFQTAYYHQRWLREEGAPPVLGLSDAHGTDNGGLYGWYYSLVFARDLTFEALKEAVRAGRCAAVTALPEDLVRAYGPLRYVQYADFLQTQVFPGHDAICWRQGDWMRQHLMGCEGRLEALNSEPDAVRRYYDSIKEEPPVL